MFCICSLFTKPWQKNYRMKNAQNKVLQTFGPKYFNTVCNTSEKSTAILLKILKKYCNKYRNTCNINNPGFTSWTQNNM